MPSNARKSFDENARDVEALLQLHAEKGGRARGRRYGLEVLNKSAVVLITAFWESYCEDIAAEGLSHLVAHAPNADSLPKDLKKIIVRQLSNDSNNLAIWSLADDGWRSVLKKQLASLQEERNRRLNTPKSSNIDELFANALGIQKVSSSWKWQRMAVASARRQLDEFVTLRGAVAHRGAAGESVKKKQVDDYFALVKRLTGKTGGKVNSHVKSITGEALW